MAQKNGISSLSGRAGILLSIVGILTYFSGVLGITPRIFLFAGLGMIILSWIAYAIEEFAPLA
jgi:hypothetical protein